MHPGGIHDDIIQTMTRVPPNRFFILQQLPIFSILYSLEIIRKNREDDSLSAEES
jgi:hypothetical protein